MFNFINMLLKKRTVKKFKKHIENQETFNKYGRACETCKFYRSKYIADMYGSFTKRKCLLKAKDVGSKTQRKQYCMFYEPHTNFKMFFKKEGEK